MYISYIFFILLNIFINLSDCYLLQHLVMQEKNIPLYNHWNCIGGVKNINKDKPFAFNVGEIPLIGWKTENNSYISTLNICKHMGSTLNDGKIKNNCLVCPYHGLKYDKTNNYGEIISYDDKLWWAYNPVKKTPNKFPFHNSSNYKTQIIEIVMNEELPYCMYNSMDINHAEYIHSGIFGFGSENPIKKYKEYINERIIGVSFKYFIKTNLKILNTNIPLEEYTYNYHEFIYPYTTWSVVHHGKKNKLVIGVNMLPIDKYKTKWTVTVRDNYMNTNLRKKMLEIATNVILSQDKIQFDRQSTNELLKKEFCFKKELKFEEHFKYMNKQFENYKYPELKDFINNIKK